MEKSDQEKKSEINAKITECYDKLVSDSKRVAGTAYDTYGEDLLAHCLDELLTKKSIDYQYKLCCIDNKLPNYIGRNMAMQIKSHTSPFYHKYRKQGLNSRAVYLIDDNIDQSSSTSADYHLTPVKDRTPEDCVTWVLETQLNWYEKIIIEKIYINKWTRSAFQTYYKLPNNSLNKDIKSTINKFKKLCSQFI